MKAKQLLDIVRGKLKYNIVIEWYNLLYILSRKSQQVVPSVATIDETIDKIIQDKCSVSRFGDGEILLTDETKRIGFQKGDFELGKRLKEVISSDMEGHLVCVSDTFSNLERYNRPARRFWRAHFFLYGSLWDRYLNSDRLYYNTFLTRPYMDFKSKLQCGNWFKRIKGIWKDRDVIIIEGEKTRLGVGNDLFDNVLNIRRILCPPQDAFGCYNLILAEAMKQPHGVLFLIALGPTATVLAYDLHKQGYQAIDIGHIDIEYEWWRIGSKRKVRLPNKYVNEAIGGEDVVSSEMSDYCEQVIAKIKE